MKQFVLATVGAFAIFALGACGRNTVGKPGNTGTADVTFARETFESLARGDSGVEDRIDWKTLQSLGSNIGGEYVIIKSEADQKGFRDGFITQFSASFREGGGKVENFTNWRVTEADAIKSVIAADSPNGLLKITVTDRDNVKRVSGFEMLK
jgi:hypothetical protein